jgi:hypothetical protein
MSNASSTLYPLEYRLTRPDGTFDLAAIDDRAAELAATDRVTGVQHWGDKVTIRNTARYSREEALEVARREAFNEAGHIADLQRRNEVRALERAAQRRRAEKLAARHTLAELQTERDRCFWSTRAYRESDLSDIDLAIEIKRAKALRNARAA